MKRNSLSILVIFFTTIVTAFCQAPPKKAEIKGIQQISQMTKLQLSQRQKTLFGTNTFKFAKQTLLAKGFKQTNDADALILSGTVILNNKSTKVDVDLQGFSNATNGQVALVGTIKIGKAVYDGILSGKKGVEFDSFEEEEIVSENKSFKLEKVKGGPSEELFFEEENATLTLVPKKLSQARIKRFLKCLGYELKEGRCDDRCSAKRLKECASSAVAASSVGTIIGAAIAAVPSVGIGAPVGAAIGAGAVGLVSFVGCLGVSCGTCAFGSALACLASSVF